jgi:hypothetical protein
MRAGTSPPLPKGIRNPADNSPFRKTAAAPNSDMMQYITWRIAKPKQAKAPKQNLEGKVACQQLKLASIFSFMLSRLPVGTAVSFRGVDWEVETEKSQQGFERRKKTRRRSAQRKERTMSDSQLLSFLRFVIEVDCSPSTLEVCDYLLRRVNAKGFGDFCDDLPNKEKVEVEQLSGMFDSLKIDGELRALILSWMHAAVSAKLYTISDDASTRTPDSPSGRSLVYSISTKGSGQSDEGSGQASQIAASNVDLDKVKEFGQVIAFLEPQEIEKQLKVLNFEWEVMPGAWETAQAHVNEVIKKIQNLELNPEIVLLREKALASFEEVTDDQTRVLFLRLALHENITAAVLGGSIADDPGSTHASSAAAQQHGAHP